eukprot:6492366-Amphidinium_carterae.1
MNSDDWGLVAATDESTACGAATTDALSDDWGAVATAPSPPSELASEDDWANVAAPEAAEVLEVSGVHEEEPDLHASYIADTSVQKRRRGRPPKAPKVADVQDSWGQCALESSHQNSSDIPVVLQSSIGDAGAYFLQLQSLGADQTLMVPKQYIGKTTVLQGFKMLPLTSSALVQCCLRGRAAQGTSKSDFNGIHLHYLDSGKEFHMASTSVKAAQLGMPRQQLTGKLIKMASAQLCHQHVHRVQLEQALNTLSVGLEKVAYAEWMSWDETPLKVGLKARASSGGKLGHTQCVGLATAGVTMLPKLGLNSNQDSRICKVLQTQQSVGMLIKCEDKYVKLIVEQACPLQVLERNSATILRSALLSLSGSSKWSNGFGFKSRVSSYDKAPYNSKASRSVSTDRQGWCSLDLTCEVHDSARAFGSTFNTFMSSHISGLISVALCLREAGAFNIFRECLREEIRSRVKVIHGLPSEHSTLHKTRLMDAFFASGSKSIPQMMLLSLLPNGDWQAHE